MPTPPPTESTSPDPTAPDTTGPDTSGPDTSRDAGVEATGPAGRRSRGWLRLLAILGPIAALFAAILIPAGLSALLLPADDGQAAPGVVVGYVVVQSVIVALLAIVGAALLLRVHGLRLRDAGLRWTRASGPSLLLGVGLATAVVLAVGLPLTHLGLLRPAEDLGLPWWAILVAGVARAAVLQGFPEELLFRGYQMTALRTRPVVAVFVSAAVFAAIHLASSGGQQSVLERFAYLALPFGFAVAAAALMIVTGSLWAAVGVHTGLHIGFMLGAFVGLGDGPLFWLTGGAVYTALGLVLLAVARRRGLLAGVWTGPTR